MIRAFGLLMICTALAAQDAPRVEAPRLSRPPALTRNPDLSDWAGALRITDFGCWFPVDAGEPIVETVAHLAWGHDGLYIALEAHDPEPAGVRSFPGRRDTLSNSQDTVCVELDATGKGQAVVSLTCNALGVQADALDTATGSSSSYDLLWDSVGLRTDYGYLVKIRVPFTSLRRLPGDWGLRIRRYLPKGRGYTLAWPQQSQDNPCDLCQLARLSGAPITNEGSPFLVIPTLTARRSASRAEGTLDHPDPELRPGLDLRYSGRALTVEGTYRPDFSAVEADVDPLVINSRYKYQYPEKRPFFQEGLELFTVRGAQQQFSSRSLLDPLYGLKATGRAAWGTWGLLQAQDEAGGAALASDGFATDGLKTRNLVAAARLDTDAQGSHLTLLGTEALLLGGPGRSTGRSGGLYLDQRLAANLRMALSRIESWTNLPGGSTETHGTATALALSWNNRHWSVDASTQATSPDLALANGFVDLTGYRSYAFSAGPGVRSATAWWSFLGGGLDLGRSDAWEGAPLSRSGSLFLNLATRIRLNATLSWTPQGREWVSGKEVRTNAHAFSLSLTRWPWLRPTLALSGGRTPDYATGLPAEQHSRQLNLRGNLQAFSYVLQGAVNQLEDGGSGALIRRAQRIYARMEYALPWDLHLRLQLQHTRYESPAQGTSRARTFQLLSGWQPNAFTQVYAGYAQSRKTDRTLEPPMERLMEKGLFAKIAYALRF